ncbi:MAG: lipopolysaccharide transport periplasmic protein LptA [Xylophilus ampelinus]
MNKHLLPCVLALCAAFPGAAVRAEKADKAQPTNIEADALRYDDLRQTSVFTGNVVLTKGTIVLRGARLEIRQDPEGYQYGVVTAAPGKRAFFRQKRDAPGDEYMEGEGETIDYNGKTDQVKFIRRAELRRLTGSTVSDRIVGDLIVYNSVTEVYTVDGDPATSSAANPGGRVRATMAPRADAGAPAAPAAGPAPALQPSGGLSGSGGAAAGTGGRR